MWFQRYSPALLRLRLRNPGERVAAKNEAGGDEQWWILEGGSEAYGQMMGRGWSGMRSVGGLR